MPEEINRTVADHVSDHLFAPTERAEHILLNEGLPAERISVTGNTIVDAVHENLQIAQRKASILDKLSLQERQYLVLTAHRQENVDIQDRLTGILHGLELTYQEHRLPIVYPIHPRARKQMSEFGFAFPDGVMAIEPLGYLDFLQLEAHAALLLTDSGGIQEEGCILQVPCVTLRDNTERPETLEVGSNALAGTTPERILELVGEMLNKDRDWENPFGDGKAGERIVDVVVHGKANAGPKDV